MSNILQRLTFGFRSQGPLYPLRALRNEFINPRRKPTLGLRRWAGALMALARREATGTAPWQGDSLQFVYDLGVAPSTFDFATYLAGAEIERRRLGLDGLVVIVVPGELDGVRRESADYEKVMNVAARTSRVRNVIVPLLSLLPSVQGYSVCGTRAQAAAIVSHDPSRVYPEGYRVDLPRQPLNRLVHDRAREGTEIFPMFRATDRGKVFVADFLAREARGRRPVVITLRNHVYSPARNSRNEDWLAFAERLDLDRFAPIFVPDTETAMVEPPVDLGRQIVCLAATWNLEIRMALYEAAWVNMAVMNGPLELAWYNEQASYLVFIDAGAADQNAEVVLADNGLRLGQSLPFATSSQKIVWGPDTLDRIESEFAAMDRVLNAAPGAA